MEILRECTKVLGRILPTPKVRTAKYVPSMYNYMVKTGETVLANTLSRCIVTLEPEEETILKHASVDVDEQNCSETIRQMIRLRLLVLAEEDELKLYLELYEVLYLMGANRGKDFYKIFTTLACNARCFYCFEQGAEIRTMTDETTDALFDYIMKTKCDKTITLCWFGGEPLCNVRPIRSLCKRLKDANVPYTSRMLTNGLLFTQELVDEAVEQWQLCWCQITLDGMHEEYKRRKNYKADIENPLEIVLTNIETLAQKGVHMGIRLSVDNDNIDSILELKSLLKQRFGRYNNISVYPMPILDEWFGYSNPTSEERRKKLLAASAQIRDELETDDMQAAKHGFSKDLPLTQCMANSTSSAIISPDGKLYTCQCHSEALCYGDIWNSVINQALYETWTHNGEPLQQCKKCALLPQCTAFHFCPSGMENCYVKRSAVLERQIKKSYQDLTKG